MRRRQFLHGAGEAGGDCARAGKWERQRGMERTGSGVALDVVHFSKELGELLKRMEVWNSQVESMLSDSLAAAASIRASAEG